MGNFNYDEVHEMIKENVGLDQPFKKLKFVYENAQWQQKGPDLDLFHNYDTIINRCIDGNPIQEISCITDYSFWTEMKQFKPTEDVYQFIHYTTQTLKMEVHRDIAGPLLHPFLNLINFIF